MAYESYSYDIKSRMMEWWRHDGFLEPINRYSQELIKDLVGSLLNSFGVVQPFHVWKTTPTEYSWTHVYKSYDSRLKTIDGVTSPLLLKKNEPVFAYMPNSKKNCHGVIQLQLQGNQEGMEQALKKVTISNANQKIIIHDITTTTDIKIFTKDNVILIDGVERSDLVEGRFDKIYSQARDPNYNELNIYDENKITYLKIESSDTVNFNLKVKMIHPIYYIEQNMRIHTVSAFPIEWVKLYGFFCHDFNNKQEWRFLWEKHYKEDEKIVYDRITKQFDCEVFYMQVKLYGIGVPFVYGFHQEEFSSNSAFQINKNLDKWGKIYGLPRRHYKTRISEEEEPYTYPPYYTYPIEQDYWYEERLVNEYRYNEDAINSALIKDTDLNNIGILQCIDPRIQDIYVYTETIKGKIDHTMKTGDIYPTELSEEGEGVSWKNPHEISNTHTTAAEVTLMPQKSEYFNNKENQTKTLILDFQEIPELPKNINITGLELELNGLTDVHSSSLIMDDRSQMLLPTVYTKANGEVFTSIDNIKINNETQYWEKGKKTYTIGGKNNLFGLETIKREQLQNGIVFHLGFTNLNTFLKTLIVLYNVKLIIHYEKIYDSYTIDVETSGSEIVLSDPEKQSIQMKIHFENDGKIPIVDKNVYIANATGIDVTNTRFPQFDLDINEKFTIGEEERDKIIITPSKNQYLQLENNSIINRDIDIREENSIDFYYKMNNEAQLDIYVNGEQIDSINANTSNWTKYSYPIKKCDRASNINQCFNFQIEIGDKKQMYDCSSDWEEYSIDVSDINSIEDLVLKNQSGSNPIYIDSIRYETMNGESINGLIINNNFDNPFEDGWRAEKIDGFEYVTWKSSGGMNDSSYVRIGEKKITFLKQTIDFSNIKTIYFYAKSKKGKILQHEWGDTISFMVKVKQGYDKYFWINNKAYLVTKTQQGNSIINIDGQSYPVINDQVIINEQTYSIPQNYVFVKHPEKWNIDSSVRVIEQVETGLYDIVVFCDDESIKKTITVREGLN